MQRDARWETDPDEVLLGAVVGGQAGAWPELMRRFERLLVSCVRKTLRRYRVFVSDDDVNDVVAAVHIGLVANDYKKLRSFDPTRGYKLSSWIGLIATTTALDALRRRPPDHGELEAGEHADPKPGADDAIDQRQRWHALLAAVNALGDADREFVRLYYDEELEPEALSARLGISVATVYSRKNKVTAKLRAIVEKNRGDS